VSEELTGTRFPLDAPALPALVKGPATVARPRGDPRKNSQKNSQKNSRKNELVVVSGASSSIGATTAQALAAMGDHVLAGVRTDSEADAVRAVGRLVLHDLRRTGSHRPATYPSTSAAGARTGTTNHAVGGNPLATATTDHNGTVTTVADLLGRVVSYTDALGVTTESTYDQAGMTRADRTVTHPVSDVDFLVQKRSLTSSVRARDAVPGAAVSTLHVLRGLG
jgi:YD repeat-containing protein